MKIHLADMTVPGTDMTVPVSEISVPGADMTASSTDLTVPGFLLNDIVPHTRVGFIVVTTMISCICKRYIICRRLINVFC